MKIFLFFLLLASHVFSMDSMELDKNDPEQNVSEATEDLDNKRKRPDKKNNKERKKQDLNGASSREWDFFATTPASFQPHQNETLQRFIDRTHLPDSFTNPGQLVEILIKNNLSLERLFKLSNENFQSLEFLPKDLHVATLPFSNVLKMALNKGLSLTPIKDIGQESYYYQSGSEIVFLLSGTFPWGIDFLAVTIQGQAGTAKDLNEKKLLVPLTEATLPALEGVNFEEFMAFHMHHIEPNKLKPNSRDIVLAEMYQQFKLPIEQFQELPDVIELNIKISISAFSHEKTISFHRKDNI